MSKLSAVIVSRNDNYGDNLNFRAACCLNSMTDVFDEVIYVDWNSPDGIPLTRAIKNKLNNLGNLRTIIVDSQHASECTWGDQDAQSCVESMGLNIGLRRATGDWILKTNIDIVMANRKALESILVNDNALYSVARRDVNISSESDPNTVIEYLRSRDSSNLPPHATIFTCGQNPERPDDFWSMLRCCGDFQMAHRDLWYKIRGFEESMIYRLYTDTNLHKKVVLAGGVIVPLSFPYIYHINHGRGGGGNVGPTNYWMRDVIQFHNTSNRDTWGFSDAEFEEFII